MKDHLRSLLTGIRNPAGARGLVREYLQARILSALQGAGAMVPLAFHGGTALRFLYAVRRYSEDLDFALERPGPAYDLRRFLRAVEREMSAEGYVLDIRVNEQRVVHSAFVRFPGLLHELGASPHADEVVAVKIEVDTRPPAGATLDTTIVRRHIVLRLQHHDRASLLAGKLHAVLHRTWIKGRDLYDLVWYLSDPEWPAPNLALLNNALRQTGYGGPDLSGSSWRRVLAEHAAGLDFALVRADVARFLESEREVDLLTSEQVLRLLQQ